MTVRANNGKAPVQPRTLHHSPLLVRLLAGLSPAAPPAPVRQHAGVAERLGHWLDWTDAIALSQVLNQPPAAPPAAAAGAARQAHAHATTLLARVRDDLGRAILQDAALQPGPGGSADPADLRRAAHARQRAMAAAIGPLRAQLRGMLAATSPALAHLAALDATLDAALGERERHSLGGVAQHLERHARQQRLDAPAPAHGHGQHTVQHVLLAELDLRLQPAQGLLDALGEAA